MIPHINANAKKFLDFFLIFVDNLCLCINNKAMINANAQTEKTTQKSWISAVKFSKEEKTLINRARQITHCDMPSLYHDCIMASVLQIVGKEIAHD